MKKPLVSLCMIVKNEAEDLPRCLLSVKDVVSEIILVDTGSSDNTLEIAKDFGARIFRFAWIDNFSAARNYSLDQATGEWILWLDADEELSAGAAQLLKPLLQAKGWEGIRITMVNYLGADKGSNRETYQFLKLFRNRSEYRFVRPVHEQLIGVPPEKITDCPGVTCRHYGYLDHEITEKGKLLRNLTILEKEVQGKPDNFSWFNLGLEYMRLGRWRDGADCLEKAASNLPIAIVWGPKLYKALATCYFHLGQSERAMEVCRVGRVYYPDYPDLCYLQGLALKETGQVVAAIGMFQQCLAMAEESSQQMKEESYQGYRALLALAQCYLSLGRSGLAKDYYLQAFASEPTNFEILLEMVKSLRGMIPFRELVAELEKALPDHGRGIQLLAAGVLLKAHLYQEGLDYLNALNQDELDDKQGFFVLQGMCLMMLGHWEKARKAIENVEDRGSLEKVLSWAEHGVVGTFASQQECVQTAVMFWKAAIAWLLRGIESCQSPHLKELLGCLEKGAGLIDNQR